jgi:RHH-type proline utilization regulon transcriptional repressor/proline dehydrogenase/delta 1-pyrroline-5-carboxylate dehydrogenase
MSALSSTPMPKRHSTPTSPSSAPPAASWPSWHCLKTTAASSLPVIAELPNLSALTDEHFGPVLHVVRWKSGELDKVLDQINATGFGLTLGLQSRIDTVAEHVAKRARVGNLYINRNQIGAVVESQPFGGEGLSGTGPKAGGPHYVARFATERVTCIDTTAAGGNATLMAQI